MNVILRLWNRIGKNKTNINTFSVCLFRPAESATEDISLALHSILHALKGVYPPQSQKKRRKI